ncbi:MAG: VCBS repeat-containing protein, partial [Saprospiraceae bacterium]
MNKVFLYSLLFFLMAWSACSKKSNQLFSSVSPEQSGIQFSNTLTPTDKLNIIEYLYFYNGSGVAAGDINNDGLPDIYLSSNQHENKLYLNKGNLKFEDISQSSNTACPGDWKTGVSMVDINGDGWLDIYVCEVGDYKSIHGKNQLFINNHDLTFTERAAEYKLDITSFSTQAAWLDYDHDGDIDMYLLSHSVHSTDSYRDTSIRHIVDTLKGDRLLRNDGGHFVNVSQAAGILSSPIGYGLGIAISDLNNDGWPDILIGNDFHENDYLYINNQNGGFVQSQTTSFGHTSTFAMGNDIADVNGDGLMDIVSLDMKPDDEVVLKNSVGTDPYDIYQYKKERGYQFQYPRNTFQLNQYVDGKGIPYFSEIGQQLGIARTDWSWTPLLADFDNNGYPDLFVANGIKQRPNDLDYLKYYSGLNGTAGTDAKNLVAKMPDGKAKNFFFSQTSP